MIRTKEDYINSLKELKTVVYYRGKKVEDVTTHPAFLPHINAAAKTYELAQDPQHEDLMTATSHLTGKKINRFTHIHQNRDDLIKKVQMLRLDLPRDRILLPALRGFRCHELHVQHQL